LQTLLLFYLVVDIISIPVDLASGILARCSKIFPGLIILENPIHHFEKAHSGRHRAETSSIMFYLVQKEQPCPSRFCKMDTKPVFNKHVMSVPTCISSTEKTKIFEVPIILKSRSFESIVKPSERSPFPQLWNRLMMQRIITSVFGLFGPHDGKQPIYSEIRIGLRTAGDEARRIFLGPAAK
jgi:hypothetical protein